MVALERFTLGPLGRAQYVADAMELRTEIAIDAPRDKVWAVLTDFERYHEWNPFITHLSGELREGATLDVTLSPPESRDLKFKPEVLVCRPGEELRWLGKLWFRGVFDGEHFFQLREPEPGRTRFVHGEDFTGLLVRFVNLTHVARGFVYMNEALKKRVEKL